MSKCGCGDPDLPFTNHGTVCTGYGYTVEEQRERPAQRAFMGKMRALLNPEPEPDLNFEEWISEMVHLIDEVANSCWNGKTIADHRRMEAARDAAITFACKRLI